MKKLQIVPALLAICLVFVISVRAWDDTGHSVVAQIAWKTMNASTKRAIINALKTAPPVSRIRSLMPANVNSWPANVNNPIYEQLFQFVATWPDFVRTDRDHPRPTDVFHHGNWHFRDTFWNAANNSNSTTIAQEGEIVNKLREFSQQGSSENLGVQVAWIVHLVGDIHQPLHCSGRITDDPVERDGDKGGNEFCLEPGCRQNTRLLNLHSFWDRTLSRNFARDQGESGTAYVKRLADDISRRHEETEFSSVNNLNFEVWSAESLDKAKREVYPNVNRNTAPGTTYSRNTVRVAEASIALAGYRLARIFRNKFGS